MGAQGGLSGVLPHWFPSSSLPFSYIMWNMSCVGLLLAKFGFSVKTWLKRAFILPDLAWFRPEEKPPYKKKRGAGKRKLLLLGLGAALAIANSIPRVETGIKEHCNLNFVNLRQKES